MQRFKNPPSRIRDRDAANIDRLVARLNGLTLDCCEPAAEEPAQHVRGDAVCVQGDLRNSARTAGKQFKRVAPLRAKAASSRGLLRAALHRSPQETEGPRAALITAFGPYAKEFAITNERGALEGEARFIVGASCPANFQLEIRLTLCASVHVTPRLCNGWSIVAWF
jgi:hypothetical protein